MTPTSRPGEDGGGLRAGPWPLLALGLLALGLRVAWPGAVEWGPDEVLHYLRAAEIARGEQLPAVGFQTSAAEARLPALYHYLLAGPLWLGVPVPGLSLLVGTWTALGALLLGLWSRRWLGVGGAFAAAAALAASPGLVLFGRGFLNERLLPPLAVGLLACAVEARARPGTPAAGRLGGVALVLASLAAQVHLSGAFFALPLLAWLAGALRGVRSRTLLPGAVVALALAAPYLGHELSTGFQETRALLRGAAGAEVEGKPLEVHAWAPLDPPLRLAGMFGPGAVTFHVGDAGRAGRALVPVLHGLGAVVGLLALAGLGLLARDLRRGAPGAPFAGAVLCGLLGGWGAFVALRLEARWPYLLALTPFVAAAAGRGAQALWAHPRLRAGAAVLAVAWVGAGAATAGVLLARLARDGAPGARYSQPYAVKRAVCDWILAERRVLGRFGSSELLFTLDLAYRDLPAAARGPYRPVVERIPYWGQRYLQVHPAGPARPVWVWEPGEDPPAGTRVLTRIGPYLLTEPPP